CGRFPLRVLDPSAAPPTVILRFCLRTKGPIFLRTAEAGSISALRGKEPAMMRPQDLPQSASPGLASRPWGLPASRRRRSRHRGALRRFSLEVLEDRRVLSSITVTSLMDSGDGSLRAAIATANGDPANDYTI